MFWWWGLYEDFTDCTIIRYLNNLKEAREELSDKIYTNASVTGLAFASQWNSAVMYQC